MQPGVISGATRRLGETQGYIGLPVRDTTVNCSVGGPGTCCVMSAWFPNNAELAAIVAGAPIYLTLIGNLHPPVMLGVGPIPGSSR